MTTRSARHSAAGHCDSHQRPRNDHWVWIESERDSGPYGSRESAMLQVRLVRSARVAPITSCDCGDTEDTGGVTEAPLRLCKSMSHNESQGVDPCQRVTTYA